MSLNFDVIVIGSGPGGYPAAIRSAQLGQKTALIESHLIGGTCLNRGCIPSKALISSAEMYHKAKKMSDFGIHIGDLTFNYELMAARKDKVVTDVRKGLEGLIKANGIEVFKGFGTFKSAKEVLVGDQVLRADKIIIATGSESREIPAFPFDGVKILNSTSLLELKKLPSSIVIIGGGVIGCEFASLYNLLGVDVTICELLPSLLPMEAKVVSQFLTKIFKSRGIKLETGVQVIGIDKTSKGVKVNLEGGKSIEAEIALVSVGRSMNTSKINLEVTGVKTDGKGNILTNEKMETSTPGIYAVGDIASKWWLAHVATHQGVIAADNAAGKKASIHYEAIPSVIFTHPEIATCGLSLEEALEKGFSAKASSFPFQALGKAKASGETEGFAQIVTDERTGQILGAQVAGYDASSLIAEMGASIANELTVECIADTVHAHPTMAEAWLESALLAINLPIHFPPSKK